MAEFVWTQPRIKAAALVAADALTNEQIAAEVGVTRQTLDNWKTRAEFHARVTDIIEETRRAIVARGIADKQNRIDEYNERWALLRSIRAERRESPLLQGVAGGASGLSKRSTMRK